MFPLPQHQYIVQQYNTGIKVQDFFLIEPPQYRDLARISELSVLKHTFGGEMGVQFFFIPLHYAQKISMDIRVRYPKSAIGCLDCRTPLWLMACHDIKQYLYCPFSIAYVM